MKVTDLRNLLGKGRFFSIEFIKKDGTLRKLTGRLGVKKDLKGKGMSYNPTDKNMLTVYDMINKGYRTINGSTVRAINCGGTRYEISL